MKRKKYVTFVLNIICISLLLTGCWSQRELTNIAFVIAIGVDEGENKNYKVSFQLVNPKNVAGGFQKSGISGPATVIYQSKGDNIFTANRATTQ
jgi:spore germination protein KC